MRDVKFRGKQINNEEWIEGAYITNGDYPFIISHDIVDYDEEYIAPSFWWRVHQKTIGQYVGFTDKNGVEIYEKDIVKVVPPENKVDQYPFTGEVAWDKETASFCLIWRYIDGLCQWEGFSYIGSPYNAYEVIGNIIDNPELLIETIGDFDN